MRYRLLASYQGAPYEAGVGPSETDVVLFAACPPPEDLHFEPATGHWRKRVGRSEVQTLHESRPVGVFRGDTCVVLDDLGDRLHIAYLGHDALRAAKLGYWEIDRGVFELITPRHEVSEIVEQRLPLPLPDGAAPATEGWPGAAGASVLAGKGSTVAVPPVDDPPLPLEAEARRAAAASRRAHEGRQAPRPRQSGRQLTQPGQTVPPGQPSSTLAEAAVPPADISAVIAGISDLPPAARDDTDAAAGTVPSWTPHATMPAQAATAAQPATASTAAPAGQVTVAPEAAPRADAGPAQAAAPLLDGVGPLMAAPPLLEAEAPPAARRRRATKRRMPTQRIFSDLAALAAIPSTAYAIGEDVDGALCLLRTDEGFEVFHSAAGARHEVRVFEHEESAYFYLFGVLVADALRTGALVPRGQ